jgi:pantetheine-phosphate adenylyltransferase
LAVAVYPGRFDPVTNGHLDIARRAASLFGELVVGVAEIPVGRGLFSGEERVALFTRAVSDYPSIIVKLYSGLTVEFARREGAAVIVRGIRDAGGFEAEFDMAMMNKKMAPEIEAIYFMTSQDLLPLSGSRIREISALGFDVKGLVPDHVREALRAKAQRQQESRP